MSEEEREQIMISEDFQSFFDHSARLIEIALDDRYRQMIDTCSIINFLVSVVREMSEEERQQIMLSEDF